MPTPPSKQWLDFLANPNAMDEICQHVESGGSLHSYVGARGLAYSGVDKWIHDDAERSGRYARAREARADMYFEKVDANTEAATKVCDPVKIQGLRLASDNLKWMLARMSPRKYGDKLQVGGAADLPPVQSNITIEASEAYKRMLGGEGEK